MLQHYLFNKTCYVNKVIRNISLTAPVLQDSISGMLNEVKQNGDYISWYSCGPTVYDSSHVGHARSYVQIDLMQRILERRFGLNVYSAMGVTNIDDKIINKSKETGLKWKDIADKYEEEFFNDMKRLNVRTPRSVIRVSDTIPDIIDFIRVLLDKGIAYTTNSGVYFDTQSNKYHYEKLVPSKTDEDTQSRILHDQEKHNTQDFALWKLSSELDYCWESPWGKGRPGWHIECSTNCHLLFGDHLDIHSGGIDLKFPHHCNEIAQCEAYSGHDWCSTMAHIGHIFIEGRKMSKSLKNFITINELLKTYSPDEFRLFCLLNHYSARVQLDDNGLEDAKSQYTSIIDGIALLRNEIRRCEDGEGDGRRNCVQMWMKQLGVMKRSVDDSFASDMNTREMVKVVQTMIRFSSQSILTDRSTVPHHVAREVLQFITQLFDDLGFTYIRDEKMMAASSAHGLYDSICLFRRDVRDVCLNEMKKDDKKDICINVLKRCDDLREEMSEKESISIIDGKQDLLWIPGKIPSKTQSSTSRQPTHSLTPSVDPSEMFRNNIEYSKFDLNGIPTHDKDGKILSASCSKRLKKQYETHKAIHNKWLIQQKD